MYTDAIARRCGAPARPTKPPPPRADTPAAQRAAFTDPVTGRSDDYERPYYSFCIAFGRLFNVRERVRVAQNVQVRRLGRRGFGGEISGERLRRRAATGHAGGELREPQRVRSRARARHSGMHLPTPRMPAHCCPLTTRSQASQSRWRTRPAAIKASFLSSVSSCARCCAARRVPLRLRGAVSLARGTLRRRSRGTSRRGPGWARP